MNLTIKDLTAIDSKTLSGMCPEGGTLIEIVTLENGIVRVSVDEDDVGETFLSVVAAIDYLNDLAS